jgi:putative endonuclease
VDGRIDCGRIGESVAEGYLRLAGHRILERNMRLGRNEIDIVTADGPCLVFVEVKTRRGARFGSAAEAVGKEKLAGMRRAAGRYLSRPGAGRGFEEFRFDVVTVEVDRRMGRMTVEHVRGISA